MLKKVSTVAAVVTCLLSLSACKSDTVSAEIMAQSKASGYYTSLTYGSDGPAFQLITVYNPANSAGTLQFNTLAFTETADSITVANRTAAVGQTDDLYGTLPECSTSSGTGKVTSLAQGQTCGVLIKGLTYDPREAQQTAQFQVQTAINDSANTSKTFNLTNVTHAYVADNSSGANGAIGGIEAPAGQFLIADCSNSTSTAGAPLSCVNALGENGGTSTSNANGIAIPDNGNLIVYGNITAAGDSSTVPAGQSQVLVCTPDSSACQNALASGSYFTGGSNGYVAKVALNTADKSKFFVTGKFASIVSDGSTISGAGAYPYFVAECTFNGGCTNVMTDATLSAGAGNDNGIYGLDYDENNNILYFAGTFSTFTPAEGAPVSAAPNYPIVACSLSSGSVTDCANYLTDNNSIAPVYGLVSMQVNGTDHIQANTDGRSIGGATGTEAVTALCSGDIGSAACEGIETSVGEATLSTLTMHGIYDTNSGLSFIGGRYQGIGATGNLADNGIMFAGCETNNATPANLANCFDVLGGGTNNAFTGYPQAVTEFSYVIGNVGAQLSISAGS